MSAPGEPRVRIEHAGGFAARVLIDDVDVSNTVTAVSWSMRAGKPSTATVEFWNVEINAIAAVAEATSPQREEFRGKIGVLLANIAALYSEEFLAFVDGVRPVEVRERVEPRGGPFVPVKLDPAAMDTLATDATSGFEDIAAKHPLG